MDEHQGIVQTIKLEQSCNHQ